MSCARPPAIIGIDNPDVPVDAVAGLATHKIFIASTREISDVPGELFSTRRAPELGLASVEVTIPPSHVPGEIEYPRRAPPDPRTEFSIVDPILYGTEAAFLRHFNSAVQQGPQGQRDVLLFVHGYNTTLLEAALRLAQFVHDSGYKGVPVLMSWASAGQPAKYVFDMNSALIAREKIPEVVALMERSDADHFDLFAHSMGAFLTVEGLRDRARSGQTDGSGRLRSVILAAPDIDADLFRAQWDEVHPRPENAFILLSRDDRALALSRLVAGGVTRLGAADAEALTQQGLVIVDLTEVNDTSSQSHFKFASSPEIVQLLGQGLNSREAFDHTDRALRVDELLLEFSVRVLF